MIARHAVLGRLLVDQGVLTAHALEAALEEQRGSGRRLGEIIVSRGLADGEAVARAARHPARPFLRPTAARDGPLGTDAGATGAGARPSCTSLCPAGTGLEYAGREVVEEFVETLAAASLSLSHGASGCLSGPAPMAVGTTS